MNIDQFLSLNKVQPADAIVVKKEMFGILDHYVIYLGKDDFGQHKFIANYTKGIQFLPESDLLAFLKLYVPVRINKFVGNEIQRYDAVRRALVRLNERAYNLILNNCEHFASWVQKGLPKSKQVDDFGDALTIAGAGIALAAIASDNEEAAFGGFLATAIGLILKSR